MLSELAMKAFESALSVSMLAVAMAWRLGGPKEDAVVVEAHDLVLGALSDADATRAVDCREGRNWRDAITIEEAELINSDRETRSWGTKRN